MTSITADQVARAVIAAGRATSVNPEHIILHTKLPKSHVGSMERSRARTYSALAVADFLGNDRQASLIFGMTENGISNIRWQIGRGTLKWFRRDVLAAVRDAIGPGEAEEDHQVPIPVPQPAPPVDFPDPSAQMRRPFISERQRAAYADLEAAMRNTAKLPRERT